MEYLLIFWGVPVGLVAVWYYLSFNDINFGLLMLSRVFNVYGNILGMDAQSVRDLLIRTFVIDTLFIAAIIYFKPFHRIKAWWVARCKKSESDHLVETSFDDRNALKSAQSRLSPLSESNLSSAP